MHNIRIAIMGAHTHQVCSCYFLLYIYFDADPIDDEVADTCLSEIKQLKQGITLYHDAKE